MYANETENYDNDGRVNLNDYIDGFNIFHGVTYLENVSIPLRGGGTMQVYSMSIPYAANNNPPTVLRKGQPIKGPDVNGVCTQTFLTGKNLKTNHSTEAFVIKFNGRNYEKYRKTYY